MSIKSGGCLVLAVAMSLNATACGAADRFKSPTLVSPLLASAAVPGEPGANTVEVPSQILKMGIDLNGVAVSPSSLQLADQLKLTPLLQKIEHLRAVVGDDKGPPTLESLSNRQALTEAVQEAQQIIQQSALAVDFTVSQIMAEQTIYREVLGTYQQEANRAMQVSNWASYYSNGALWAVGEALAIPSAKRPKYAISSGIFGIIAGVTPSIFSLYAMHAASGRKHPSCRDPNMLAKILDLKPDIDDEYPEVVWTYLNTVPPGDRTGKTRRDQIIDRWVCDNNIKSFTDRHARAQIELVSGLAENKKGHTISLLQTRDTMLEQLGAEILKMKRLLLELSMAVHGEKHV